ncbi:hypothetical protein KR018_011206, partial [Drosophila ironensis]
MGFNVLDWQRVNLFDITALPALKCPSTSDISCHCCSLTKWKSEENKITLVFCDKSGVLIVFNGFELVAFRGQARQGSVSLCALTSSNLLATATQDKNFRLHIDLYDLQKLTKKHGAPVVASVSIDAVSAASCLSAEIIEENTLALGVGFENGEIRLCHGKVNRFVHANIRRHAVSCQPITGVYFDFNTHRPDAQQQSSYVYVTCSHSVYCFLMKEKGLIEQAFTSNNEKGETNDFCTMRKTEEGRFGESMLVVAREDAVYSYIRDGRGPCIAIEGKKKHLVWVGPYLIVVVGSRVSQHLKQDTSTLTILDTENKIIVFHKQMQNVFCVIGENDLFYIITNTEIPNTYNVFLLNHRSLSSRVRVLIEKKMYEIALRSLDLDGYAASPDAANVHLQYGHYLLLKGDVERAVKEYIKTIGFVKPYLVISKLLCSRYNTHLEEFLVALAKCNESPKHCQQLLESCRNQKHLNMAENSNLVRGSLLRTRSPGLEEISNLSQDYFNSTQRSEGDNLKNDAILNMFLEYGSEKLLIEPNIYINCISGNIGQDLKNVMCFLSILSQHDKYCADLLTEMVNKFPMCDKQLYYYLLLINLDLWHSKKTETDVVLDILTNTQMPLDKSLTICKLYNFLNGIKQIQTNQRCAHNTNNEIVNKGFKDFIDRNSKLSSHFNKRSFLIMLKSACTDGLMTIDIKPIFMEKRVCNFVDPAKHHSIIKLFNEKIMTSRRRLSLFNNNPIEFRNDTCDICHINLNQQSIYFFCQHSFHKHCLIYSSSKNKGKYTCVLCIGKNRNFSEIDGNNAHSDSVDIINIITKLIALGIK